MEFVSSDAAHMYYLRYAYDRGFSVKKNGGSDKEGRQRMILTCTKGGAPKITSKKAIPDKNKKVEAQKCENSFYLKLDESRNVWVVTGFIETHNHPLWPEYSHKMRCFRTIKDWAKNQLEINDRSGVSVISNINAVMEMGGRPHHCSFTERDARNYLAKMRRGSFHKGDAESLMLFFRGAKKKDPKFYYSYKFDEENRLDIVFWADSTSQSWYEFFGDVVTFDATYIVNKYDLPVAPLVGVNHHGQSIIFGCAMMTHEDTDSYKWIITNWLECMGGKAPQTIITDQSAAMKKAIVDTLPHTRHRHCIWHILDKLDNRIGNKEEAGPDIRAVIYESKTEDEFESNWESTISHHSLQENEWLSDMYDIRKSWVPVYLNEYFWAGMISTQRSESINSFLDRYVNSKTTLRNFVRCFDLALARLRRRESDENYECVRGQSRLISKWNSIEQQFAEVYTNNMFIKFQQEIKALIDSKFTLCERQGNIKVYNIDDGERKFKVEFNCQDETYTCECHRFETNGLVCRHALLVYKQEDVAHVPSKYILDRWSKSFKRNYLNERAIAVSVRERRETHNNLHLLLYPVFQKLIDYAALDEETQKYVVEGLNGLMVSISKISERTHSVGQNNSGITAESGTHPHSGNGMENEDIAVKDPLKRRKRGRNPVNRKKSILEVKREQAKKKRIKTQQSACRPRTVQRGGTVRGRSSTRGRGHSSSDSNARAIDVSTLPSAGKPVTLRCRPQRMVKFYKEQLAPLMTESHNQKLNQTPFAHFFEMPQIIVSNNLFKEIFDSFDPKERIFKIAGCNVSFIVRDVALSLGGQRMRFGDPNHRLMTTYFPDDDPDEKEGQQDQQPQQHEVDHEPEEQDDVDEFNFPKNHVDYNRLERKLVTL
ncbi:hypothetical protein LUZ63_012335 [Rhynchospora breviuscula]|uniref:SWIM-type domain-containing protein n=1 Tax=Rhynchospora breviuscula TaxID=2022672 RepID=A0A9Q0HRF1_9POAL|nr:hypothetical protein LUZ63_012335 [Rhynchospora breviuscula]